MVPVKLDLGEQVYGLHVFPWLGLRDVARPLDMRLWDTLFLGLYRDILEGSL